MLSPGRHGGNSPTTGHSLVRWCRRAIPQHPYLPNAVTLPWIPEGPPDIRGLGNLPDGWGPSTTRYVLGDLRTPLHFRAPALVLEGGLTAEKLGSRQAAPGSLLLTAPARRSGLITHLERHQEWAFALLTSSRTSNAFNLEQERRNSGSQDRDRPME